MKVNNYSEIDAQFIATINQELGSNRQIYIDRDGNKEATNEYLGQSTGEKCLNIIVDEYPNIEDWFNQIHGAFWMDEDLSEIDSVNSLVSAMIYQSTDNTCVGVDDLIVIVVL